MLSYDDDGDGPPLVLLHGLGSSSSRWLPVVDRLRESHRCVRVDLPGHGRSPVGGGTLLDAVGEVHDLVTTLGLRPPGLLGHSAGGTVATVYGVLHPTAFVVSVDSPLDTPGLAVDLGPPSLWYDDPAGALEAFEARLGGFDELPEHVRAQVGDAWAPRLDVVLAWFEGVLSGRAEQLQQRLEAGLPHLSSPYLAVLGNEPSPRATAAFDLIPRASVEVWPGRHWPHLADVERFVARVRALDVGVRG